MATSYQKAWETIKLEPVGKDQKIGDIVILDGIYGKTNNTVFSDSKNETVFVIADKSDVSDAKSYTVKNISSDEELVVSLYGYKDHYSIDHLFPIQKWLAFQKEVAQAEEWKRKQDAEKQKLEWEIEFLNKNRR